jgi:hypothetical protein
MDKFISLESIKVFFRRRVTSRDMVSIVVDDINSLLGEPHFDHKFIMSHLLNKMCQITNAEYGFIGSIVYDEKEPPYLQTHAISNIAWNSVSHEFLLQNLNGNLRFENLDTIFGEVMLFDKSIMINNYDQSRAILPKGHPHIKRFMGIPYSFIQGRPVMMVGLCNKIKKFNRKDAKNIKQILNIVSYLMVDVIRSTYFTQNRTTPKEPVFSELKRELNKPHPHPHPHPHHRHKNMAVMCNRDHYLNGITDEVNEELTSDNSD